MSSYRNKPFWMAACSHEAAKFAIQNWHYSGSLPAGKKARYGVWEHGEFKGAVVFSRGAGLHIARPFDMTQAEVVELTRIGLRDHEVPVSKVISVALKLVKEDNPGLRIIVSYADSYQGHKGGVYQASNWNYLGWTPSTPWYNIDGAKAHSRQVGSKYGTNSMEK